MAFNPNCGRSSATGCINQALERRFFMAGSVVSSSLLTTKPLIYRRIVTTGAVRGTTGDGCVTNGESAGGAPLQWRDLPLALAKTRDSKRRLLRLRSRAPSTLSLNF